MEKRKKKKTIIKSVTETSASDGLLSKNIKHMLISQH